jgi:xanthine/uracil permease
VQIKYAVDERPPLTELVLLGFQWLAMIIPIVVIIGRIVSKVQLSEPIDQTLFMEKTAFVIAITLASQILIGHRLPLVAGPATVLVVGLTASQGFSQSAVYTSIMVGGFILAASAATGLFARIRTLFTPRVVSAILLLIAFTLAPSIVGLIITPGTAPLPHAGFAILMTLLMFLGARHFAGFWKSTLILWSILVGTGACALLFPGSVELHPTAARPFSFFTQMTTRLSFEPGVLLSFLVCYIGLSVNDLGSIESVGELVKTSDLDKRVTRGITISGVANILAGFLGVAGPVNYSLSPGVIMATGCASRFTLLPTALLMACLACSPKILAVIGAVPSVVIGAVFLYLMTYQIAAGLVMLTEDAGSLGINDGLALGLPLLLGTIVSFMPQAIVMSFPPVVRPLAGNGFLVGVVTALIVEHLIFRHDHGEA